jgi:hypothetical protein
MVHRRFSAAAAALLLGAALVASAAPAAAHHKPGHSGGPGSNCPNPAQQYPPGQQCEPRAAVSDSTTTPNQRVRWYGEGYAPNTRVVLTLQPESGPPIPLGSATSDSFGFAEQFITIPRDAAPGSYRVVSTGMGADGRALTLSVPISVSAAGNSVIDLPDTGPGGSGSAGNGGTNGSGFGLPRTGGEIGLVAAFGILLAGAGTAAIVAGRRRRTAAA